MYDGFGGGSWKQSAPGIFAAGDIARWPDPHAGDKIRVEHWVVAERHAGARSTDSYLTAFSSAQRHSSTAPNRRTQMLGWKEPCTFVPYFWSQHYDVSISYVGHAEKWDRIDVKGSIADRDCTLNFKSADKTLAVVTIGRDLESLRAEAVIEQRAGGRKAL